jgi:lactate dehydrogenase-like 2-hydroxyacid dehydrogenase
MNILRAVVRLLFLPPTPSLKSMPGRHQRFVVTLTRRLPEAVEARLAARYDLTRNRDDRPLDADEIVAAMNASDAIVSTLGDPLTAQVLNAGTGRCRLIAHFGVGYDNLDVAAAKERGIAISNTPGVLTDDTADMTILLMLAAARRVTEGTREIHYGTWSGWRPTHLLGQRLSGKTLGVVGFGRIGRAVAQRAAAGFGMHVQAWSRSLGVTEAAAVGVIRCETLDTLLATSDFVSLHVPRTPETHHLIGARQLALLQNHAILVNTARGDVIDQAALIDALSRYSFAAAGLDVFEGEPTVPEALYTLPNVFALPHIGSATVETRTAMGNLAADNLDAFFEGRPLPNPVN